jgi:hypothetical protein
MLPQIAKYLHPRDLLHVARTSKILRAVLMTKNACHIWTVSFRNLEGLPECPDFMSGPQYAAFLFELVCSVKVLLDVPALRDACLKIRIVQPRIGLPSPCTEA